MQSEMEPRNNQQQAPPYTDYAGNRPNRSAQYPESTVKRFTEDSSDDLRRDQERPTVSIQKGEKNLLYRVYREDKIWGQINIVVTLIGLLIIITGLVVSIVNPAIGIITIVSGLITDCIPLLSSRPREASWKRLKTMRQQKFLEKLIENSSGELQVRALEAYTQLGNPKDEEGSK